MVNKTRNLWESLGFAADGIVYSIRTRNIRIHCFCALGTIVVAGLFAYPHGVFDFGINNCLVISLEIANTAVETS